MTGWLDCFLHPTIAAHSRSASPIMEIDRMQLFQLHRCRHVGGRLDRPQPQLSKKRGASSLH